MKKNYPSELVNQTFSPETIKKISNRVALLPTLILTKENIIDAKNVAFGLYSPLRGFLRQADFLRVIKEMRLADGNVWPIPIVLDVPENDFKRLKNEQFILLVSQEQKPIAILKNPEFYQYDKEFFAQNVFGTLDKNHPGVEKVFQMQDWLLGGEIKLLDNTRDVFPEYYFTPQETRTIFAKNNWQTIVAFQTRNVPHRGHEFLQKYALRQTDGLFIQPVIGEKKIADFKDEFILASYRLLIDNFYPKNKTLLGILPLRMRYAGPREAVFHALIRKNFGCTHFIVGRDHAGAGDYYGPFDAQKIFDQFAPEEIGIAILKLGEVSWCPLCSEFVFEDSCYHRKDERVFFSGTKIRKAIENNETVPAYFMRPEVMRLLSQAANPLVDDNYKEQKQKSNGKGFVLWFTGLSGSGKSTVADALFERLKEIGQITERLDGDIVRKSLTKDLGFSKEDRDENIRRIGFVASTLSRNSIPVLASFISPYRHHRDDVREQSENFIEVFCDCPLEVCEQRDVKGLYKKARTGEIPNFTGVSDPYEPPENPEIVLKTGELPVVQCVEQIIAYLQSKSLI